MFIWKVPILCFFMCNLCLGIFSLANIYYLTFSGKNGIINFIIALLIKLLQIIFYFFVLKVINLAVNAHKNNYNMSISTPLFSSSNSYLRKIKMNLKNFSVLFEEFSIN